MSAFTAGSSAFAPDSLARYSKRAADAADAGGDASSTPADQTIAATKEDALSTVIKWVPGEVIGAYAAAVTALVHTGTSSSVQSATGAEGWLLAGFMVGAMLMTVLGGYNSYRRVRISGKMPSVKRVELWVRGCLSAVGLLIWSCVIPGTVTNKSDLLLKYAGAASSMVFCVAILFGLIAEFMVLPTTLRGLTRVWPNGNHRANTAAPPPVTPTVLGAE